jgi:hypothetical protein
MPAKPAFCFLNKLLTFEKNNHMKKLLLLMFAIGIFVQVKAQELEFGIKGGLSGSKLTLSQEPGTNTPTYSFESNNTINFGAYGRFVFPVAGLYVQPELIFNSRASNFKVFTEPAFYHKANYVDIPVLFGFRFLKIARVYGGPNFQILTKQLTEIPNNPDYVKTDLSKQATGYQLGVGADLARLRVDVKWDFNNNSMGSPFTYKGDTPDLTSRLITIQLGFKLFSLLD